MRRCQHCGAGVPNYAGFCGVCGQLVSMSEPAARERTLLGSQSVSPENMQTTLLPQAGSDDQTAMYTLEDEQTRITLLGAEEEKDDEDKRKRALLGLPLVGDAIAGQANPNVPMVQGTPQIMQTPTVTGTPSFGGGSPMAGEGAFPPGPVVLPAPQVFPQGGAYFPPPPSGLPHGSPGPHTPPVHGPHQPPQTPGCMVWLLVIVVVVVIILSGVFGVGLTILAPALSLEGNASVATGDTLHLHGAHFIPGDSVTCILDGSITLTAALPASHISPVSGTLLLMQQSRVTGQVARTEGTAAKTITVSGDGTFAVSFVVGPDWKMGQHTIRATEAFSPRSATTTFTVTGDAQPTSTATAGITPTATATTTPSPTATPQTKPGLIAVTPNNITFGPISEGYTQPASTQVLLNTTGTGPLNWTATWDTVQASWLKLNIQSGQVQEPGSQTIIVSAVVGTLKAGTYNATILFSSDGQNGQNLSLPVSLTVQAGCVKATPTALNFTTTIGTSNPASQTVTLNNCGAIGNWSATTTGGAWLLISPAGGNLNSGANQRVIVSASLANVAKAGTYNGLVLFKDGATQVTVNVTFNVLPPPTLGINMTSITLSQCTFVKTVYQCKTIILNNSKAAITNLNWTATASGIVSVTVTPAAGTLQPGQTAPVEVDIARVGCDPGVSIGTVTFTGPANTITVALSC